MDFVSDCVSSGKVIRILTIVDDFTRECPATEVDTSRYDRPALETWTASERERSTPWDGLFNADVFNIDAVRSLIRSTGYPEQHVHFVKGRVEDTLPEGAPGAIALLRLSGNRLHRVRGEVPDALCGT